MTMPVYQKICQYVNEQRISRKQVAFSMRITQSKLSLLLNGKRRMTVDDYLGICKALALPPMRFLSDGDGNLE